MYGAILGDMIGSPYEFDMGDKTREFSLFSPQSHFTDDSGSPLPQVPNLWGVGSVPAL